MKKQLILGVMATLLIAGLVFGLPSTRGIDKAKWISPAIGEGGEVTAPPAFAPAPFPQLPEDQLTKIVFIRYAPAKEPACNDNGICEPRENWKNCPNDCPKGGGEEPTPETTCYGFLAGSKPRWNWVENYYYSDPSLEGSSAVFTWEAATSGDIFGSGVSGSYPWGVYDYFNSLSYGDYSDPNVIAVTAIWFRGKNIYEYDIQFDTDYFPDKGYDLPTVVLHEFGHGAGLDDLYDEVCDTEVMYGKYDGIDPDLGPGDETGIQKLYGA